MVTAIVAPCRATGHELGARVRLADFLVRGAPPEQARPDHEGSLMAPSTGGRAPPQHGARMRPWEISPPEQGEAEKNQPPLKRERMIGRFRDPHGGLGMPYGFIEPAELGEHRGGVVSRERRLDAGRSEALVTQITPRAQHFAPARLPRP
jgi:hypothetical protein